MNAPTHCLMQAWEVHIGGVALGYQADNCWEYMKSTVLCGAITESRAGAENGSLTEEEEEEEERERLEAATEVVGEMQLTAEQLKVLACHADTSALCYTQCKATA